jgi:HD superfamily phosphodiesterase
MKEIYKKIWELAKPFYKEGREMDIEHIKWMINDIISVCRKENLDETILLPLVILHDIGYSKIQKKNPFELDSRKEHMREGAKITREILEKLKYSKSKIKKIVYLVSIHDNWAFGNFEN